ncbi:MAG: EAL domain-containing protein [Campylobacterales bacterium]|nr:EAL domain-containing protein [Campylobacterales bacterium]
MKKLSLSKILSVFVLVGVIVLVTIMGVYFDSFLKKNAFENAQKRIVHGYSRLYSDIIKLESELKQGVAFIQNDIYLESSIDLINNYQDKQNYNAILLDEEKKSIAIQLLSRVKLSLNNEIALYDKNEELIAFVRKEDTGYRLNFLSYEAGQRVLYSKLERDAVYQKFKYKEDDLRPFKHPQYYQANQAVGTGILTYHLHDHDIDITAHQSILEDDSSSIKAHIEMSRVLGSTYFKALSEMLDMTIYLSTDQPTYDPFLLKAMKNDKHIKVLQTDEFYYAAARLITQVGDVYFIAHLNKSTLLKALAENRIKLVVILLLVTLFVLMILQWFVNYRLTIPLHQLMEQIKKLEGGDYSLSEPLQTGDELEVISNNINQLAQTINKRESQLKASKKSLEFLSHHDALTALPNRRFFMLRLNQAIDNAERTKTKLAVLFMDIDQFKYLNDTLGHDIGDQLLQKVAKRLDQIMRSSDMLARIGGDEFNIFMEDIKTIKDIEATLTKILEIFNEPFQCGDETISVTASIGIAIYPDDGKDSTTLIKNADMAMYAAKDEGHNSYSFFTQTLANYTKERSIRINALKSVVGSGDEFFLEYQPKISLETGKVVGIEALVRWDSLLFGKMQPDQFIFLAEETNMIIPIGRWVMQKACEDFIRLQNEGYNLKQISINVSSVQLYNRNFVTMIKEIIKKTNILPSHIELEITESYIASNRSKVLHTLKELRDLDIDLAIDDFGTGYSSMSYLQKLPVTRLKIDKSFIEDIPNLEENVEIVKAIIGLAKTFNLSITAEGVENEAQIQFLKEMGCNEVQGYYYSKPLTLKAFKEYYQKMNG